MMTAVFLLRIDSVTSKGEGEAYYILGKKGITHCNVWSSPQLTDHRVIIATGNKAINKVFNQHKKYHITEMPEKK